MNKLYMYIPCIPGNNMFALSILYLTTYVCTVSNRSELQILAVGEPIEYIRGKFIK